MIWVAWRVQRSQYLLATAAAIAIALYIIASGLAQHSDWAQETNHVLAVVLFFLPGLFGLGIGAPLVGSEAERGTDRLSFTQSISRRAWYARKILVGGIVAGLLAAIVSIAARWWVASGYGQGPLMMQKVFGITGTVVVAYALFSFALGVLLGAYFRNAGWAFAVGAPISIGIRLVIDALHDSLVAPIALINPRGLGYQSTGWALNLAYLPVGQTSPPPGQTWASENTVRGSWRLMQACTTNAASSGPARAARFAQCAKSAHLQLVVQYQPDAHYWALQAVETAIFAAIAILLLGFAFSLVTRWQE